MLDRINIVISTVWREEDYIATTLASLSLGCAIGVEQPVCLCVGSPSTEHIDRYRSQTGITVIEMGANTWSWIQSSRVSHRATWNHYRCLTQPVAGTRGTLVLEDDVRFARGWYGRFNAVVADLEECYDSNFVLALYCPWPFALEGYKHGRLYVEYPPEKFYGIQGVYYTNKTRQGFAKYLKLHGVISREKIHDLLLGDYMRSSDLPLFATAPSLIQHMGRNSSIVGPWHDTPNFVEDLMLEP